MLKTVTKDDDVIKIFTYNNTILTKVKDNDIMYDKYGNIIKIGNIEITYNSRGLMDSYNFKYFYNEIKYKKFLKLT